MRARTSRLRAAIRGEDPAPRTPKDVLSALHYTLEYDMSRNMWVLSDDLSEVPLAVFPCRSAEPARQMVADLLRTGARVRIREADGRYLDGATELDPA